MTHIYVCKLTTIGSNNGLSPGQHQAIIWTNAGILLIRPFGTNFSEILIGIYTFSFKKKEFENVVCEIASILSRPQCVNNTNSPTSAGVYSITQSGLCNACMHQHQGVPVPIIYIVKKIYIYICTSDMLAAFDLYGQSYIYMSFTSNKTIFTKYSLTQWISKVHGEPWCPLNKSVPATFIDLMVMVNANVYNTGPNLQVSSMTTCLNFTMRHNTDYTNLRCVFSCHWLCYIVI